MLDKFAKKESPVLGYAGFGGGVSSLLTLASGKITYVDDVFSTYLYKGNSTARSINNGIDLAGEGGLVWTKSRTSSNRNCFLDTERGVHNVLFSDATLSTDTDNTTITSFNSNGYTMGTSAYKLNVNTEDMCSWTFRKCPGFFDIVTYTGNGSVRTIAHNLKSVPGSIWVKRLDTTSDWRVYHRSLSSPANQLYLNANTQENGAGPVWNSTHPTSTVFTVGTDSAVNANNGTYVAYIFAHNDGSFGEDSDEAVIKCGSYTGSGSIGKTVDLGFEPQWMIVKSIDQTRPWVVIDNMRGMPHDGEGPRLLANDSAAEVSGASFFALTPTGVEVTLQNTYVNSSGEEYVYIAIRRPHKQPEVATDVFGIDTRNQHIVGSSPSAISNFVVDMSFQRIVNTTSDTQISTRLTGNKFLITNDLNVESSDNGFKWDYMNGWAEDGNANTNIYYYMWKRAAGYFDVVTYTGHQYKRPSENYSDVPHNLGVVPEMIWIKNRSLGSSSGKWIVYHKDVGNTDFLVLNENSATIGTNYFGNIDPTSSVFTLFAGGLTTVDYPPDNYIAYLFATLSGISKVGQYTGNGSNQTIDCGFSTPARFVLIKKVSGSGNWYVWDSERGITQGADPYISLNINNSQLTGNKNYVYPDNAGFGVQEINGTNNPLINENGQNYIFYAIA